MPPGYVIGIAFLSTLSNLNNICVNWGRYYSHELYNLCISANLNEHQIQTNVVHAMFQHSLPTNADNMRSDFDINA